MATTRKRGWDIDWAGRHGTATGTLNATLTPTAAIMVGRHLSAQCGIPHWWVLGSVAAVTFVGVVLTLARAAVSRKRTHPVTVVYHVGCWIGVGVWMWLVVDQPHLPFIVIVKYWGMLVFAAVLAAAIAWLADSSKPDETPSGHAQEPPAGPKQLRLDVEAEQWESTIAAATGIPVDVPAIQVWDTKAPDGRPTGRTVQVEVRQGHGSWRTIADRSTDIGAYLNSLPGCGIRQVRRGGPMRTALIEVVDVNLLAEEQPYPSDYSPLSVHNQLPMMTAADGTVVGPELRERCFLIVGERGSGKSNTAQVCGAGVARMTDALGFDIDCTGNRLSQNLLGPFLEGKVSVPAVFWSATDPTEAWLLLRAMQRGAIARNNGYGDLCVQANDDKVPISQHIRQLVLRGDEIRHFASMNCSDPGIIDPTDPRFRNFPSLSDLAVSIPNDQRAAGCSEMLFGLRATNDILLQDHQSQLAGIGVLKATSMAEYRWAFGNNPPCDPTDAPWPGCIQMRLHSSDQITPYHVWRLRPKQLREVALAIADYQPPINEQLDELTTLAMNGRDAQGQPFEDLLPGELDCLDSRWNRYFDKFGIDRPTTVSMHTPTQQRDTQKKEEPPMDWGPAKSMEEAQADMQAALDEVQRRINQAQGGSDEVHVDDEAWRQVMASWDGEPYVPPLPGMTNPIDGWRDRAMAAIRSGGSCGVGPKEILAALEADGIVIHRDTLNRWLAEELKAGRLRKPRHGKWVATDGANGE